MNQFAVSLTLRIDTKLLCTYRKECVKENKGGQPVTYISEKIMLAVEIDISSIEMPYFQEMNQFFSLSFITFLVYEKRNFWQGSHSIFIFFTGYCHYCHNRYPANI